MSKTWCVYVSALLFKKIYVAPNKLDFEAFKAITRHPTLSKCVGQLVYDGAQFIVDCTETQYIAELQDQTKQMLIEDDDDNRPLQNGDREHVAWIQDCGGIGSGATGLQFIDLMVKWESTELITKGYRKYWEHARYQQNAILSGDFPSGLAQGLTRLPSLESITLEGAWPHRVLATLDQHRFGSPLARTWDPFHPCPRSWCHGHGPNKGDYPDGERDYYIITIVLIYAKKQIHEFEAGRGSRLPGIHPYVFDSSEYTCQRIFCLDVTAFQGLKRLHLEIARFRRPEIPIFDIGALQKLLASMNSLQRLDLKFPMDSDLYPLMCRLQGVFPVYGEWKYLESMSLQGVTCGTAELLNLVVFQMPVLKTLELGEIRLQDGTWEAVLEFLKQSRHLSTFDIAQYARLLHNDDEMLEGGKTLECSFEDMKSYVEDGGRHPCLKDGQPDSATNLYMMDDAIPPALRQRLFNEQA